MIATLLGGLSPQRFLDEYWQKKPLLVRQALPGFKGLVTPQDAFELATDEDIESRLVWQDEAGWQMQRGPFRARQLKRRGAWTVLLQGLNLYNKGADELLRAFNFIPYARLDDVMVSYATDGGGVGPHFDSYDVFLLQGLGQRHWGISAQRDMGLLEDAPLRILRNFKPSQEWVLQPGDMLYLPPQYAHHGTAVGECMTYSIGFRAPSRQELITEFLGFLADNIEVDGLYADPDLRATRKPAEVPDAMAEQLNGWLQSIQWSKADVARFLGSYLSEPKAHVFFKPPAATLTAKRFFSRAQARGVRLDPRTQLLYYNKTFFLNGEAFASGADDTRAFRKLADLRETHDLGGFSESALQTLYEWYEDGFLHPR